MAGLGLVAAPRRVRGMMFILVIAPFLSGVPAAAEETEIAFGPYIQNVTHRTATICWYTLEGESVFQRASGPEFIRNYRRHAIRLNHLKPNTSYEYDVLANGQAEGKGTLTTFPREIEPFRFVAFGDTRSRHDVHQRIVERIATESPLFVINTGDLVSDGLDMNHWEVFFRINRELMRNVPYYPALGNHERDSEYYFDFFDLPGNERYYSFTVGDALIMMLDTEGEEFMTPAYLDSKESTGFSLRYVEPYMKRQKAWVEHQFELHHDAGFIFVGFHKPLFSAKASRVKEANLRRAFWGGIFERHGVQVVFNGHDHHYHHAFNNGTHYMVTGGGGAGLYEVDAPQPQTVKTAKAEHYIRVEVEKEEAVLTVIGLDGEIIDVVTVTRRNGF